MSNATLAQPLGLKVHNGNIHVICRDQLAVLRDLNGDGFVDYLECFNNDHQVTEHFHEFAMGLQTDAAGNFYYAKSARHALPALVPQHGTLLRVSADGRRTDILAYGFRAANGVCLNPDGSFYVTDQEGHWMPKNRINHIPPGEPGFYGNMFGYHEITDSRDEAMRPPVLWITNSRDRSPAELLWVPEGQWGELGGALLMTSYGTGQVYQVLTEEVEGRQQGALVELPVPEFPTGVMRGRFHPRTGDLYLAGMAAWATDRTVQGGFYRMRRNGRPLVLPVALRVGKDGYSLTFSAGLDAAAAMEVDRFELTTWSLRRSAGYGSPHVDEKVIKIAKSHLLNPRTVLIRPEKHVPAQCYRLVWTLRGADGVEHKGAAEGTVHAFP